VGPKKWYQSRGRLSFEGVDEACEPKASHRLSECPLVHKGDASQPCKRLFTLGLKKP
jgi:hypothetical protein